MFRRFLVRSRKRKVFVIADRHPVHFRKTVRQWLETHSSQIEVFYLSAYSPQLNPASLMRLYLFVLERGLPLSSQNLMSYDDIYIKSNDLTQVDGPTVLAIAHNEMYLLPAWLDHYRKLGN